MKEVFLQTDVTVTMSNLVESVSPMFTTIWEQIGEACTTIVSEPFLLLTVGFLIVGGAIGILGRLISRN